MNLAFALAYSNIIYWTQNSSYVMNIFILIVMNEIKMLI